MPVESASYATQFNTSSPASTDPRSEGDDHLRLIKSVIATELDSTNKGWAYSGLSAIWHSATSVCFDSDETDVFEVGRRVKAAGSATGTLYGEVTSATYSAASTVHFRWDASALSDEALQFWVGPTQRSGFPNDFRSVLTFGVTGDGSTDDTAAVQRATTAGVPLYWPKRTYVLSGTIAPAARFLWLSDGATFKFQQAGTYSNCLNKDGTDSGDDVAFDLKDCNSSRIVGPITLTTDASVSTMASANRANITTTLVAISASTAGSTNGSGAESQFDELTIERFGSALYQSDHSGAGTAILPFTRWRVSMLKVRFCLRPIVCGASGNAFNDAWFDVVRFSRCSGLTLINGTDFNCGSMFFFGMDPDTDAETATVSATGGTTTATTSSDISANLAAGGFISLPLAEDNKAGTAIDSAYRIASVSTTTITVRDTILNTVGAGGVLLTGLPWMRIASGSLTCQHLYVEGYTGGIELSADGVVVTQDLKISAGEFTGRLGAVFHSAAFNAGADLILNDRTLDSLLVRSIVALGMVTKTAGTLPAERRVAIKTHKNKDDSEANAYMVEHLTMISTDILPSGHTNSGSRMGDNVVIDAADAVHHLVCSTANTVKYSLDNNGLIGTSVQMGASTEIFHLANTAETIANTASADIFSAALMEDNSTYMVFCTTTDKTYYIHSVVMTNGSGTVTDVEIASNGAALSDNSGALSLTNNAGQEETFRCYALKVN